MTNLDANTKPLKILFISDVYFPRINGVSTSIRTFVEQMQVLGPAFVQRMSEWRVNLHSDIR